MKRTIEKLDGGSLLIGEHPQGCRFCTQGAKMVLFVTGLCASSCYYCPLSSEKAGKDVIFADEMPVSEDDDIIFESQMISAEGVGISGGDPLCQLERTKHYIELLREEFGAGFHIHLYTSETALDRSVLEGLIHSGLDEIRFHPQTSNWSGIKTAIDMDIDVGIEVPAIPGKTSSLMETAERAELMGVKFLNINELEASETNFGRLSALGMRLTDMGSASVEGSRQTAVDTLNWATEHLKGLSVHFCSAQFKDAIQMRRRLERRLENVIRPFEERVDDDPLLIIGLIRAPHGSLLSEEVMSRIYDILATDFEIPNDLMNLDWARMRIEIAPWIIEEVANGIRRHLGADLEMGIAYEYPSWDRLQTLFEPV